MSDIEQRIAALSPEQRELLLKRMKDRNASTPAAPAPTPHDTGDVPLVPTAHDQAAPLSFAQQRLWFIDQLETDSSFYNVPTHIHIQGSLHVTALEQSLNQVVQRHEVLRTTFAMVNGQPAQVVNPELTLTLPLVDLQGLSASERDVEIQQIMTRESWRPFNLAQGPLLRVLLLQLGREEYILVLTTHHIVSDRWAAVVLVREVATLYQALTTGQEALLPDLPVQYADYAIWQRRQLQGPTLEKELGYWKQQLAGAPAVLQLPTDRPRPPVQTFHGTSHTITIPRVLTDALTELARREGVTLFMTLLAAFQTLLARYSNQNDIVVGTPIAGRTRVELERLIGLFFNTLVLRTDLSGNPSFRSLLRRVREVCLDAYAHQNVPFEKLVEELRPERDLAYTPLFQVLFDLRNTPTEPLVLPDLVLRPLSIETNKVNFDLALGIDDTPEGLICTFYYKTDLFDRETIERMAAHYQTLLAAVVADATCSIATLRLLPSDEHHELLTARNATQAAYPAAKCFHELVAEQVERTPDAIAVVCGDQQLTYRALDRAANRLAHALQARGVGPEVRVGICLDRSLAMLVGLLGIFKAGGAFVPLDPSFPPERLGFILADAQVPVLLTQTSLVPQLEAYQVPLICLDDPAAEFVSCPPTTPRSSVAADNLSYLIYTSGSTGRPKGVLIPHQGLMNYLWWAIDAYTATAAGGAPVQSSIAADAIFPSLFLPLLAGKPVIMVPESQALAALSEAIQTHAPFSLMKITPSQLEVLNRQLPPDAAAGSVHTMVVGAEALRGEVLHFWQQHAPDVILLNEYGPTETVVGCSIYRIDEVRSGPVPIGLPIANTQFYVLNQQMQPVPIGVPGELYIGGDGVAWGYHRRPDLTAQTFVPDPFSTVPGARLYKTGDLVRYLPDRAANIEFLGRRDDQVKIRGYRVEPGEVEAVLGQHPAAQEVVVLARTDATSDQKRLVAYVVPRRAERVSAASQDEQPELWPSMGEYFLYDELLYHVLTHDDRRQQRYRIALERLAPGQVVVDIGTGRDAILARMAVEAGARRVYAIELLDEAYAAAVRTVKELGLEDRIQVIQGDARTIELPELVDGCVSQIIGVIGGAEGAATIIEDARRLVKPGGWMIPERSITKIAAVSLPDVLADQPQFGEIAYHYVSQTFTKVGYPFDLRVCIKRFPASHLRSTVDVFEDLIFTAPLHAEYQRGIRLVVTKAGRLDGFLVWLTLRVAEGATLDVLAEEYAWLPVYFPVFDPAISVEEGDVIEAECSAILDGQTIHPDYAIRGQVRTANGSIPFAYTSAYAQPSYQSTPFYRRLFAASEQASQTSGSDTELLAAFRAHLKAHLPEYMVPSAFVLLDRIPLTPHGKIDRHALPAPDQSRPDTVAAEFEAPRTPTEELIAGVWGELLHVRRVGIHDNFFALGGHSLLGTQLVSRLRQVFQIDMPLMHLFESPTVAGLAAKIVQSQADPASVPTMPIQRVERDGPLPLSFIQQRLWLLEQLAPESGVYNIPLAARLIGNLNLAALDQALHAIVERHEVLRITVTEATGQPAQVVWSEISFDIPVIDLESVPRPERDRQALLQAQELIAEPFDLTTGPLFRAHLLRLAPQEHILLLTMHHIVFDGWSGDVFIRDMSQLYTAFVTQKPALLPALPIQYPDFAAWQQQWLQGDVLDAQLAYWQNQLQDLTTLSLPTDFPRPPVLSFQGATEPIAVPVALTNALIRLSRQEGVTLFMTLLATLQIALYRYTAQDDIAVGTTVANRTRTEIEGLIGCFVNNLVMRTNLAGAPSVREVLQRVRNVALGAYAHQDLPFEKLVEALQPERDNSRNPLFQILFALQTDGAPAVELPGLAIQGVELIPSTSQFDMALSLAETPGGIQGILTYSTDLFTAPTIRRFIGHFTTALEQIVDNLDTSIDRLTIMPAEEQHELLVALNATDQPLLLRHTAHVLFEQQAARAPDATAIVFEDAQISYRDLNRRANQLAQILRAHGVGPDVLVGIAVERSIEQIIAVLGVLKAGGAYVPLDSANPVGRLATILADAKPKVVITANRYGWPPAALIDGPWSVIDLIADQSALDQAAADNLDVAVTPDHAAYVIYTSGSTGQPKGVLLAHQGLCNLALAQAASFGVTAKSRVLQFASFGFDASVSEIFVTLMAGATLVLARRDVLLSTDDVLRLLRDQAITTVTLPPSYLALLEPDAVPGLETIISAGERCPVALAQRWATKHRFVNAYGPTEATIGPMLYVVDGIPEHVASVPIGRPIANTRIYILDREMQPVPIGVTGELYIAGAGLARGYLNRPELTAQAFRANPFVGQEPVAPYGRLYRTGDLARYLPDGNVEFLGRIDSQVKLRGFRIEIGEIEAVLARHPAVQDAVVVARADRQANQKDLAAYIVPINDGESEAARPSALIDTLRAYLKGLLPEYMVPAVFVILAQFPITPNGKIDLRALPAPEDVQPNQDTTIQGPRTPTEEVLVSIWSAVLELPQVDVEANFFDLGGHSLLATQVMVWVRETFQVDLPLRSLFTAPTIAALATKIDSARSIDSIKAPPIEPVPRDQPLPLSFTQQRLWLLDQLTPANVYTMPMAVRLHGALNVSALAQALEAVVRRHEVLRTTIAVVDGEPLQIVAPSQAVHVARVDLRSLPPAERERIATRRAQDEAQRSFDLVHGPLFHTTLLELDEDDHVLLLTLHHIITDGWSMSIFIREIAELYHAAVSGTIARLTPLPVQYADYAVWQRQWLQGETLDRQLNYWQQQLAHAPSVLNLPTDRPRPAVQTFRGDGYPFSLPSALTGALTGLSRKQGVTIFMTMLAAWQVLLARYSGQDDILVGTPIAGRTRAETEGLIGCFLNTLVLRSDLSGDPSFLDLLERVRKVCLDAYDHQDIPFELIVEAVSAERDLGRHPIFQVMLILQNAPMKTLDLPDMTMELVDVTAKTAKFDLVLSLAEHGDHLSGMLQYNTDLFDERTVARMAAHFQFLLEQIVAAPAQPLGSYSLVTPHDAQVLPDPQMELGEASYRFVPDLFADMVQRAPDAIAVSERDRQWTYRELARQSETIARMLQAGGVAQGDVIAVSGARSCELIATIMAVLMSGGVILNLDLKMPEQRRKIMVEEARARYVVLVGKQEPNAQAEPGTGLDCLIFIDPATNQVYTPAAEPDLPAFQPPLLPLNAPAYIQFTSGTTGVPKGILGMHKSLSHCLAWLQETFAIGPHDRLGQLSGLSFDVVWRDLFLPLVTGATLCLPSDIDDVDPTQILPWLERERITLLHLVPTRGQSWLEAAPAGVSLTHLRWVFFVGEPLTSALANRWRTVFPQCQIANCYGPAETTLTKCYYLVPENPAPGVQPVGNPLPYAQALVLTQHGLLCGIGEPGEIVIRTPFRSLGYFNAPEEQQKRFVRNPFRDDDQDLIYYSGDRGRYRPDGSIDILGRTDHQLKIRGVRIEIGEIQAILSQHPAVAEAAVLAHADSEGEKHLYAYVVPQRTAPLNGNGAAGGHASNGQSQNAEHDHQQVAAAFLATSDLKQYLRERLPAEMIPEAFVVLDGLPLTPNGKLNRAALPIPEPSARLVTDTYCAPRDLVELKLVQIWEAVLKARPIGVKDSFFDLGGHSMSALRLLSEIQQEFGQRLALATVFQQQTIEQIAHLLRAQTTPLLWEPLVPLQPNGTRTPLFLVHPAGGTVFCYMPLVRQLNPDQPCYALQARGLEEGQTPTATIEAMAGEYLEAIRGVQPHGPYILGGWSMGGLVALEMAQQLRREHESVALLAVFDTHPHSARIRWSKDTPLDYIDLRTLIDVVGSEHVALSQEQFDALSSETQLQYVLDVLTRANAVPPETELHQVRQFIRLFNTNGHAMINYQAQPYPSRIALFKAQELLNDGPLPPDQQRMDIALAWQGLANQSLEVYSVPGNHDTMVRSPNVEVLVERLQHCLDSLELAEEDGTDARQPQGAG